MKRYLFAAVSFIFLNNAGVANAQNGQAFYTGSFKCSDSTYRTDWKVTKGLEGGIAATIFYQRQGDGRASWFEVYEQKQQGGSKLLDKNGANRLSVTPDEGGLSARWINSGIGYGCEDIFKVRKTEQPKLLYDALFSLLEVENPSDEQVSKVSELLGSAPIIYTLPELDQQSYAQRLEELREGFWKRYSKQIIAKVALAPLVTPEDRQQFTLLLRVALTRSLIDELGSSWYKTVYAAMQQSVDRLAISDMAAVLGLFSGGQKFCERLNEISSSSYDDNLNMVELAAGLPVDYWARADAEEALKLLRGCDKNRFADKLAQGWPEIEQQQLHLQPFIAEHKRLLGLPVSAETFLASENLTPAEEFKKTGSSSSLYYRFLGEILDARRGELVQAALSDLEKNSNPAALGDEKITANVRGMCTALQRIYNLPQEKVEAISQACKAAEEMIGVLRCDAASAASGADADLLNSTVEVYNGENVSIKDILCKLDDSDYKMTFETSGFLMWKKNHLMFRNTRHEDKEVLKFILQPSEKSATWVLITEDAATKSILQDEGVDVEKITACWSRSPSCPHR